MTALTADEMVDQALGRVVTDAPMAAVWARGPMYRRVGYRQRQLYVRAAQWNPERYGTCATANLTSGKADLNDIADPVPTPELIQRVEVLAPGTSGYAAGTEITLVRIDDQDAALAPRAVLRDRVLMQVGTDLALVTSVTIYYPRLPDLFLVTDDTKVVELEAPWDTLLEVDLALWILSKAAEVPDAARAVAIQSLKAEESGLLADFEGHVRGDSRTVSQFLWPRRLAPEA